MSKVTPVPSDQHPREPCADCPYKLSSLRAKWHASEFEKVLAAESDMIGKVFHCHKHRRRPVEKRGLCAGYAIDQKRRGVPSLALRMVLIRNPTVRQAFEQLDENTRGLFRSPIAMCRFNLTARARKR